MEASGRIVGRRTRMVNETVKGAHQIAEYVGAVGDRGAPGISRGYSEDLPMLAARRDEYRIGAGEQRSFDEGNRTWTEVVLSGVEGV